jgi:maltose/moltooligosaccharide transporter
MSPIPKRDASSDEATAPTSEHPAKKTWLAGTLTYTSAGLIMLFFWLLLGDFAYAIRERSAHAVVQLALKSYGATNTFQSYVLVFIPHAVALLLQPVIAFKSDRFRSRWGRRIPFMLWTTPFTFLSMIGLAYCPWLADRAMELFGASLPSNVGVKELTLWFFAAFYFVFELACITSITLFASLVNDVVPRAIIGRFYGAFRAVSLAAGIVFSSQLLRFAETHFTEIFVGIGVIFGVGFTLMCLFVKEGEYPPPAENQDQGKKGYGLIAAVHCYWRECFHLSFYRWVFASMLFANLTFQPFNNFRIVYAKSLNVDLAIYGNVEAMSFAVSFLIAFPLGMLVDRFHPLRLGIATMAIYSFAAFFGAFFITGPTTFLAAFMIHTILSGMFFTTTAALGALLFPKVTFGQFTAAAAVITHLGSMALGATNGPLLDAANNDYRVSWMLGGILCVLTLGCLIVTYIKFLKQGGPKGYVAPLC